MKKTLLIWGIVLLVIINLSSLGTMLYFHYWHKPPPSFRPDQLQQGLRPPGPPELPREFLRKELALSVEQLEKFERSLGDLQSKMKPLGMSVAQARRKLMEEILSESKSPERVDSLLDEMAALQGQIQREVIDHLTNEISLLDDSQKEKFRELIKKGHHHMGMFGKMGREPGEPLSPTEVRNPPKKRK